VNGSIPLFRSIEIAVLTCRYFVDTAVIGPTNTKTNTNRNPELYKPTSPNPNPNSGWMMSISGRRNDRCWDSDCLRLNSTEAVSSWHPRSIFVASSRGCPQQVVSCLYRWACGIWRTTRHTDKRAALYTAADRRPTNQLKPAFHIDTDIDSPDTPTSLRPTRGCKRIGQVGEDVTRMLRGN